MIMLKDLRTEGLFVCRKIESYISIVYS
jgi:hypothetical protein